MRLGLRFPLTLLLLLAATTARAEYGARCFLRHQGSPHWEGPIRKTRSAAQRDADAHVAKHPGHHPKVDYAVKDIPDDENGI